MSREGSLDAPTRHPIDWTNPDFTDPVKLDAEMRRVFDICHGCRRCFNLCDSFPRLFDLIDQSPSEELDSVASADFAIPGYISVYSCVSPAIAAFRLSDVSPIGRSVAGSPTFFR